MKALILKVPEATIETKIESEKKFEFLSLGSDKK